MGGWGGWWVGLLLLGCGVVQCDGLSRACLAVGCGKAAAGSSVCMADVRTSVLSVAGGYLHCLRTAVRHPGPIHLTILRSRMPSSLHCATHQPLAPAATTCRASGDAAGSSAPAGRKTLEVITATDSIIDALDVAEHEQSKYREWRQVGRRRCLGNMLAQMLMLLNDVH